MTFPHRAARLHTISAAAILLALSALPLPAFAGMTEEASGIWAIDLATSLDLLDRRNIYSPNQITEASARAAGVRIVLDLAGRAVTVREEGGKPRALPLEEVTEKKGSLLLHFGGEEPDDILVTPLPGGRVRVGPPFNIILMKVADLPRPAAP